MNINRFQLVLPINTEILIPENDSVRLLDKILDKLDYTTLWDSYSHLGRKPSVSPKTFFKILVYAYMNNIFSTRKIEQACRRDINFIWLLGGEQAPDHNAVSRFRSGRLAHVIDDLFYQLVNVLGEMGEIAYENIFVDGTKIEANANKYSFVWRKSTEKNESRLQEKIKKLVHDINTQYGTVYEIRNEKFSTENIATILVFLEQQRNLMNIEFVYGKGKRKKPIQRQIEKLQEYKEMQKKYDGHNEIFKGRNSFSKTDHDATFMHMKDDHMRNSQLKPGYNVQIGVEGEYIVGVGIFSERSDQLTFKPFIEELQNGLSKEYKNIVADAGYESEENYRFLETNGQNAFIKPSNYEISKKGSFKKKINLRENMFYDEEKDEYICYNQKRLKYTYDKKRKSKSGYESKVKVYECECCNGCEYKEKCSKAKGNRRVEVAVNFLNFRAKSLKNITSDMGKKLRMNRSIQVEGAFGVLKEDYGFRRFLMRGNSNVKIEFMLLCLGYNVNKLHSKISKNRCGVSLFDLKIA